MKKFFIFTIIFTLLLCSCSKKSVYRNDISCVYLTDTIKTELNGDGGYAFFEDEQIKLIFEDISLANEYSVIYSLPSQNIDEFGIFKTDKEGNARKLADKCREYLKVKYEDENAFIASYAPEELPKLKDAEVKVFGNYVAYAILSENDRELFFSSIKNILK